MILLVPFEVLAKDLITVDKALVKIYSKDAQFDRGEMTLTDDQMLNIESNAHITFKGTHSSKVVMYNVSQLGNIIGYAFEDTVMGKWGPIHYLVGLDLKGSIVQVIILDYQEIRGKPIAKKRFLRQYVNKDLKNHLKLKKDINGVTGATISSRSLTNGVRKIVYILEELKSLKN